MKTCASSSLAGFMGRMKKVAPKDGHSKKVANQVHEPELSLGHNRKKEAARVTHERSAKGL